MYVPKYYFKALLDVSYKDGYKAAGFWLANEASDAVLVPISIDELEKLTGIDFFDKLDAAIISKIEQKVNRRAWR